MLFTFALHPKNDPLRLGWNKTHSSQLQLGESGDRQPRVPTPVIKWVGGKRAIAEQLARMAPSDSKTFYEPFLGGAAFYLNLSRSRYHHAVLSDSNRDLIELYQTIRDEPYILVEELDQLQPLALDKNAYYSIRATDPAFMSRAQRSARFIYLNKAGYNGLYRVNKSGNFNVPFGSYTVAPRLYDRDNLLLVSDYLQCVTLRCGDFQTVLADADHGAFVYMDPPYVPLTSTANFTNYTRHSFPEKDQRRLAVLVGELTTKGCRILLSNSDTPLVRSLYKAYNLTVVYASRRVNSDASGRGKIAELAIRNYADA